MSLCARGAGDHDRPGRLTDDGGSGGGGLLPTWFVSCGFGTPQARGDAVGRRGPTRPTRGVPALTPALTRRLATVDDRAGGPALARAPADRSALFVAGRRYGGALADFREAVDLLA